MRDDRVFFSDLAERPQDVADLPSQVGRIIERCKAISPEQIILIKVTVYDAAHAKLAAAALPVVNVRTPSPSTGRQTEFEAGFARGPSLAR